MTKGFGLMAYDEALAQRIRDYLAATEDAALLRERKMFGGVCFTLAGNMCVGIIDGSLIVRLPREEGAKALEGPHVRPFAPTGRPMAGWLYVDPEATKTKRALAKWIDRSRAFVATLPPK